MVLYATIFQLYSEINSSMSFPPGTQQLYFCACVWKGIISSCSWGLSLTLAGVGSARNLPVGSFLTAFRWLDLPLSTKRRVMVAEAGREEADGWVAPILLYFIHSDHSNSVVFLKLRFKKFNSDFDKSHCTSASRQMCSSYFLLSK